MGRPMPRCVWEGGASTSGRAGASTSGQAGASTCGQAGVTTRTGSDSSEPDDSDRPPHWCNMEARRKIRGDPLCRDSETKSVKT